MRIVQLAKANQKEIIEEVVSVLRNGGLIIYPTETCYGVGVDATNKSAVEKLLKYKQRPEGKAVSIAVSNIEMAKNYVEINETAKNLYTNFLPGPLTVISKSKGKVISDLEAENGTLGVRMPDYHLITKIIEKLGKPITATSANLSGRKTPYSVADVLDYTTDKQKNLIDFIIDAGELPHNPPSTVVDTTLNDVSMIRKGKIDLINLKGKKYFSKSAENTIEIAKSVMEAHLENLKNHCLIFALQGNLGAGKTQFAKGIGKALEIKENIKSPTFTLMHEYKFQIAKWLDSYIAMQPSCYFFHIDTWRMVEGKELLDLGFEKMIKPGNVVVIEWLEKVKEILDKVISNHAVIVIWVEIDYIAEEARDIKILRN